MKMLPVLAIAVLALSSPASAAPVTLDACGHTVVDAMLGADLDCTATPGFAVIIAPKGRLDLAGHRLTSGAYINGAGGGGVQCQGDCIIEDGGGSIVADPTATDWYMAGYGVHAEDSSIDGNCVAPYSSPCADIVTYGYSMPLLVNTTCSTSLRYRTGSYVTDTWGICLND